MVNIKRKMYMKKFFHELFTTRRFGGLSYTPMMQHTNDNSLELNQQSLLLLQKALHDGLLAIA